MEKHRKWQLFVILSVIALTVYNILPTLFYYLKPLHEPVSETQSREIADDIEKRVDRLESEAREWIGSFCDLLQIKAVSISPDPQNPQWISVHFSKTDDAARFRSFLPRAGSLVPFAPAQLSLASQGENGKEVLVQRRIPIRFEKEGGWFSYVANGSPEHRKLVEDRATQIALSLAGPTEMASALKAVAQGNLAYLDPISSQLISIGEIFTENPAIGSRCAAGLTQGEFPDRSAAVRTLISSFDAARDGIRTEKQKELSSEDLRLLEQRESRFAKAEGLLKKWESAFASGGDPFSYQAAASALSRSDSLALGNSNPLFCEISIDPSLDKIRLIPHPDVAATRAEESTSQAFEQLLIDQIAKVTRDCNETVRFDGAAFEISLNKLPNASGFLVLNLENIARAQLEQLQSLVKNGWRPKHPDLQNIAIVDLASYAALSPEQKALSLVLCSPLAHPAPSLRNHSIYLIARGIQGLAQNYEQFPDSEMARAFSSDLRSLDTLLKQNGFFGFSAAVSELPIDGDFFFEKRDFAGPILAATREDFAVRGTQKFALLEFSDREQRILTENRIETRIHEDLIKWKDEHRSASVSINPNVRFDVPKPTRSIFWSNAALSARKFFRGDDRKIIRWGLDLSGGKTVQIELRDANGRIVKSDADIKQGINELYNRVNKIGVSEVSIRQVGHHIVLDFPGSQALSASELIRASTMYFHVVNEKFSPQSPALGDSANRFLQEVWNEAIVSGKTDPQSVNEIAWKHLYGDSTDPTAAKPRSDAGKVLWENGLRLQSPQDPSMSNAMDDSVSKIALLRGSEFSEWHGQSHPLLLVFRNYALEGSQLDNIRSAYDPSKGNYLSFDVIGASYNREGQRINPRSDLHAWTSRFSKEKVAGTPNEAYTRGRGWRMAVLLNDSIISSPTLDSALRDSAMISGSFSQREAQKLASDLKAGSLTFTPHILSEKNVSPELGQADRTKGIVATAVALILVISSMVAYYRFAGLVASVAVLFNLLILWATLQNLGATLTLAGIAGVILTVGMAVDANVLVFERIKEEFAITGRISSAIAAGYKKAYSAIIDSNVTTIIAALILLNFDAGPIKSFAVNLIIGIVSSMFTALFMTRFYFTGWVQNPKNKALKMANWIRATRFDFLKKAKFSFAAAAAIILAGGYLVFSSSSTIFGMDFTGGFSLNLELQNDGSKSYVAKVEQALQKNGADSRDFQIRELNPAHSLRVLFGNSMEQNGKPFHGMPLELEKSDGKHPFEKNPRISWVVESLQKEEIALSPQSLAQLDANWTSMSGQMSDSMRNNALIGLLISFVCIFVYLAFRFEYKFAAAALICLFHDVLITIGLMGLLHAAGVPVQIDLNTVAALMTIVGYSLNDTIIIFDRIREEMRLSRSRKLTEIVNHALNQTLSRTTITSGTTLLVLVALVALGGPSIFSFALVMTIGVFFGTLSSWFIASPLMLYFHGREEKESRVLQS
jgi:SecD/SecF fusion protein